jgi:hypothetical protein
VHFNVLTTEGHLLGVQRDLGVATERNLLRVQGDISMATECHLLGVEWDLGVTKLLWVCMHVSMSVNIGVRIQIRDLVRVHLWEHICVGVVMLVVVLNVSGIMHVVVVRVIVTVEVVAASYDVIVWVAVIRNESAAIIGACQLDHGGVDLIDGGIERLAVVLDHDCAWVDGSSCELRVDSVGNLGVAADFVEDDTVTAHHGVSVGVFAVVMRELSVRLRVHLRDLLMLHVRVHLRDLLRVHIGVEISDLLVHVGVELGVVEVGVLVLIRHVVMLVLVVGKSVVMLVVVLNENGVMLVVVIDLIGVSVVMVSVVMVSVVMVVVAVVVVESVTIDNDVIVWVAIVGDESAAIIDTGQLDFVGINLVDGDYDSLAIVLDDSLGRRDSRSSELSVGAVSDVGVATDHVEFHSVGASLRLLEVRVSGVVVDIIVILMVMGVLVVGVLLMGVLVVSGIMLMVVLNVIVVGVVTVVIHALNNNVVVWVAVVRDEGATIIIAGKLNRIGVNFIHGSDNGLAIGLKDSRRGRHSSSC